MNLDRATLARLAHAVAEIASAAGVAILDIYDSNFIVEHKSDRTPLTAADLASHELIVARLGILDPILPILSEESIAVPYFERARWHRYWLVDPLDGTREFIKRNGEFTVNIALIENHVPVLGVVQAPVGGRVWLAWRGGGAWVQAPGQVRHRLATRPRATPLVVTGSRSHTSDRERALIERLAPVESLALGSSLKFCRIAEGAADLYLRLGRTSEWDTAAAECVLSEAGGAVYQFDGERLRYNARESLLNPEFYACGDPHVDWTALLTELT